MADIRTTLDAADAADIVAVGMLSSADDDCGNCIGTGWSPDFESRTMHRCSCVNQTEPVRIGLREPAVVS